MQEDKISHLSVLTLIFLSLIWGSSFILIKKALLAFDPITTGALRVSISCLAFVPMVVVRFSEINRKHWKPFLLVGLTGSGIPAFLYATAQTQISSSVAGLLNSLTPIFTFLLGILFFEALFSAVKMIGLMMGFAGAASLLVLGSRADIGGNPWFGLFVMLGTMCYATSVNLVKKHFQDTSPVIVSAVSFCMIGPPAIVYLLITDFTGLLISDPDAWYALGAVAILSLVGTVLASIVFFKLVQKTNPVFASSVAYIMPGVALGWGFLDGETLGLLHGMGLILILAGVYLIKRAD